MVVSKFDGVPATCLSRHGKESDCASWQLATRRPPSVLVRDEIVVGCSPTRRDWDWD